MDYDKIEKDLQTVMDCLCEAEKFIKERCMWISVKDRLPPEDKPFLAFMNDENIHVASPAHLIDDIFDKTHGYITGGWCNCMYCGGNNPSRIKKIYSDDLEIIFWMPLPSPPKA